MNYVLCREFEATHVRLLGVLYRYEACQKEETIYLNNDYEEGSMRVDYGSQIIKHFEYLKEERIEPYTIESVAAFPVFDAGHDVGLCLHIVCLPEQFRDKKLKVTVEVAE